MYDIRCHTYISRRLLHTIEGPAEPGEKCNWPKEILVTAQSISTLYVSDMLLLISNENRENLRLDEQFLKLFTKVNGT